MKTLTSMIVAIAATLTIAATSNAQQRAAVGFAVPPQQQAYIAPQQQNPFYFGMQLELVNTGWQKTLRVVHVTWGSPAQRAGLEVGDEIRTVNGRGFQTAYDSFHAVRLMNQFTSSGGGAPAAASGVAASSGVGAASGAQAAWVGTWPRPAPQPIARMVVRNVRNGWDVPVTVYPTQRGGGAPAVSAAASSGIGASGR